MKNNCDPNQPLTQDEMHWNQISLFLTAMSVGILSVAVLATAKSETSLLKAAGLILASIAVVGTTMTTMMAIFAPRNTDPAQEDPKSGLGLRLSRVDSRRRRCVRLWSHTSGLTTRGLRKPYMVHCLQRLRRHYHPAPPQARGMKPESTSVPAAGLS